MTQLEAVFEEQHRRETVRIARRDLDAGVPAVLRERLLEAHLQGHELVFEGWCWLRCLHCNILVLGGV